MNKEKSLVCIACPRGCLLTVGSSGTGGEGGGTVWVRGNRCPKGEAYGRQESVCPMRILTSTVASELGEFPRVPVKTDREIPLALVPAAMKALRGLRVVGAVRCGDILMRGIAGTSANLVATEDCGWRI